MISETAMLNDLAARIRDVGYAPDVADRWAVLIGDTPGIDGSDLVVQSDTGEVLARLPLSAFPDVV